MEQVRYWLTFRHRTVFIAFNALTGLILRFCSKIRRLLGRNVLKPVSRLPSIVLAALAARMMHDALIARGVFRP
jgi:small neutral amino acid transporter SnatA (MarC family)